MIGWNRLSGVFGFLDVLVCVVLCNVQIIVKCYGYQCFIYFWVDQVIGIDKGDIIVGCCLQVKIMGDRCVSIGLMKQLNMWVMFCVMFCYFNGMIC